MSHPSNASPRFRAPATAALTVGMAAVLLILFVVLGSEASAGRTLAFDDRIMLAVHAWTSPTLTVLMIGVTQLGTFYVVGPLYLIGGTMLVRLGERRVAVVLAVAVLSDPIVIEGFKLAFARPRPELWTHLYPALGYSYPSGHTALATVAYGLGAAVIAPRVAFCRRQVAVAIAALALIILVGLSRIYLGVHYPTDVIGGSLLGSAWILLAILALGFSRPGSLPTAGGSPGQVQRPGD